jgi:hypothetical protein
MIRPFGSIFGLDTKWDCYYPESRVDHVRFFVFHQALDSVDRGFASIGRNIAKRPLPVNPFPNAK